MAEKKFGIGSVIALGTVAAVAAGAVVSYLKREELKILADEIVAKLKNSDEAAESVCECEETVAEEAQEEDVEIVIDIDIQPDVNEEEIEEVEEE